VAQAKKAHDRITYDDFSLGDYGVNHPRHGKNGEFHGKNVVVYRDGTLGPRNGLIEQPLSGANYVNGKLNAFFFGVEHELATPRMIYSQGTRPKFFKVNDMTAQNPGLFSPTDIDATPEGDIALGVLPRLGFNMFLSSLGDGTYMIDALGDTLTKLTGAEGAHDVQYHLNQIHLIGIGSAADGTGHKNTYSGLDDPTSWPVENEYLVGLAWVAFRGMRMANGLVIVNQDSEWHLLQGDPIDGSLRRIDRGLGPALGNPRAVVVSHEVAWFLATGAPGGSFPGVFDGSKLDVESLHHLRGWMTDANATAVQCDADDDLLFVDNDAKALMRHEGVWTRHEYEVPVGEWAAPYEDQRFYLAVDGTAGTKPKFYRSTFNTGDGPAIYDGQFQSPGDGDLTPVDAWVEFPEMWQDKGEQVRPMFVILEFTSYDTSGSAEDTDSWLPAHIACEVDVIDRFGVESTQTVDGGEWNESDATVASDGTGVRRRHIFRLPVAHFGSALQLRFTGIRGVKIEKAVLDFEIAEQLDRA
jgi:hypothetical protein